jgi:hypothetical protein
LILPVPNRPAKVPPGAGAKDAGAGAGFGAGLRAADDLDDDLFADFFVFLAVFFADFLAAFFTPFFLRAGAALFAFDFLRFLDFAMMILRIGSTKTAHASDAAPPAV